MAGALEGIRVIEYGSYQAIPAAGAILADWGADVVKLEPLDGESGRHTRYVHNVVIPEHINPNFEVANRNKRSVGLDLTAQGAPEVLARLVSKADVFMTNHRPSSLEKFGATYDQLSNANKRLIYVRLSGYGPNGPDRDKPGFDRMAFWARTGLMHRFSAGMPYPPDAPSATGDVTTSLAISGAIAAALFTRERTGKAQLIDLSLYHTGLWVLQVDLQIRLTLGQEVVSLPREMVANPLWNSYQARDGRWIQLAMYVADRNWPMLCAALGKEDLVHDCRFSSLDARREHSEALIAIIDGAIAEKTSAEWSQVMAGYGLFFQVVQTLSDAVDDPQALANDIFVKVPHPVLGEMTTVASPATFHETPATVRSPAPEAGQHTEELLLDVGYDWDEIQTLRERGIIR